MSAVVAKSSKKSAPKSDSVKVEAPKPVEAPKSAAPATEPKRKAAKKAVESAPATTPAPATPAPVSQAVADAVASVESAVSTVATENMSSEALNEQCVSSLKSAIDSLRTVIRLLRESNKHHLREVKESSRKRKTSSDTQRSPAGFTKPCKISDALADFLRNTGGFTEVSGKRQVEENGQKVMKEVTIEVKRGAELTRQEVTKLLNKYFEVKGLRDPQKKTLILYEKDAALKSLITLDGKHKGKPLTYFNLQAGIKSHFTKV